MTIRECEIVHTGFLGWRSELKLGSPMEETGVWRRMSELHGNRRLGRSVESIVHNMVITVYPDKINPENDRVTISGGDFRCVACFNRRKDLMGAQINSDPILKNILHWEP